MKQQQKSMTLKVGSLKRNKTDKLLARFIKKKKRDRIQVNKIRKEKGEITTNTTEIQSIIRDYSGGLVAKSYPTLITPWTVACQAPLSMGFSRQEYWSGLPFPSL